MAKFGLGKGLGALIPEHQQYFDTEKGPGDLTGDLVNIVPLANLKPNPDQPRKTFSEESIEELANSIKRHGLIQPIIAEPAGEDQYIIIAGERRYRAAIKAGLTEVPVILRPVSAEKRLELSLIENIQREDLNAVEIALAYQSLIEEYNLSQEELSDRVGKNRATVANFLRLLKLPAQIQVALKNREVDMGHARALLALDNPKAQIALFEEIKKHGYSVRKVEELVKAINAGAPIKQKKEKGASHDYTALKKQLSTFFHSKVQLSCNDSGKGKISIPFGSQEELQRLIEMFDKLKS